MNVLDLFSGIGGFSLGLERAGMKTVAFCEQDESCQKVLKKHWPDIEIFNDVKNLSGKYLKRLPVDVICGGFPCQDISVAGNKKGLIDEKTGEKTRSGLWFEFKRIIKEIKPRYVIIENVANLRSKGLATILKDLRQIGYDCEWHVISARSVGAPHLRERIWIIAYSSSLRLERQRKPGSSVRTEESGKGEGDNSIHDCSDKESVPRGGDKLSNPNNFRLWKPFASEKEKQEWWAKTTFSVSHWKEAQSIVCGVDDGISRGMDKYRKQRIKQLGNTVLPQIPQIIGMAIMEYEGLNIQ